MYLCPLDDIIGNFPICVDGIYYLVDSDINAMVFCAINGNAVLAEPMKNKSEGAMVETYQNLIKSLNDADIFQKSIFWIMKSPNDTSRQLKIME